MPAVVENMPGNLHSEDNFSLEYDDENSKSKQSSDGDSIQEPFHEPQESPIHGHQARRSIVDELLTEIYSHRRYSGPYRRRLSSTPEESDHSTSPDSSAGLLPTNRRRFTDTNLRSHGIKELKKIIEQLQEQIKDVLNHLVRQLTRRDHLFSKRDRQYDFLTAILQAASPKRGVDTRMKFSIEPRGGDTGFMQWHDAMKMVARLPGGIPTDFRKRLWLTMADKHLQNQRVDWAQARRVCFNERSNPDDDELGTQIVKDLHRTGCSLFCGEEAEHNQALLKRVLLAYARWNKMVGYCQGFNMLAALILEVTEWCEENALKVMIYLIEGVLPESYFANNLRGLSVDMAVFRDLLRLRLPNLSRHLDTLQAEARESASGASYEPPLTNVFTMQWFLTLFSNCLPKSTVLRVWDLIFLEGNEVLLRTALAIWDGIADRIMTVESADEFYSIMHVLTREMLEFGLMDANYLVKTICMMAPFPFPQLAELRDKYTYNITPFTAALGLAKRAGFRLFHSDDEDDDDEQQMAVAAWCFSSVLPHQVAAIKAKAGEARERSASIASASSSSVPANFSVLGPGAFGPTPPTFSSSPPSHHHSDSDRMTLDISALKKQYAKLRERQKQAHIILTGECKEAARLPQPSPNRPPSIAVNHLLVGKKPLTSKRGQMQKGGTIHLVMQNKPSKLEMAPSSRPVASPPPAESGETLQWKQAKQERRASLKNIDLKRLRPSRKERAVSSSSSSNSSSSTELCDDDQGTLSDFDSDEDVPSEIPKIVSPTPPKTTSSHNLNSPIQSTDKKGPALDLLGTNNNSGVKQWDQLSPASLLSQAESATSSGLTSGPDQQISLSSPESDSKSEEELLKLKKIIQGDLDTKDESADSLDASDKFEMDDKSFDELKSSQNPVISPSERCSSLVDNWLKANGKMFGNEDNEIGMNEENVVRVKGGNFEKDFGLENSLKRNGDEENRALPSTPPKSHADDELQSYYSAPGSHAGSTYMSEDRSGSLNLNDGAEIKNDRLKNIQSFWIKEFENEKLNVKDDMSSAASGEEQAGIQKDFSHATTSDERFKKYILESSSKFLEQEICNSGIKRNGFSTETYKWSDLKENDSGKDLESLSSHFNSSELAKEESDCVDKDDTINSKRIIPRRMSCTDLPEVNSFDSSSVEWFLNKIGENETNRERDDIQNTISNAPKNAEMSYVKEESFDINTKYCTDETVLDRTKFLQESSSTHDGIQDYNDDKIASILSSFVFKSTKNEELSYKDKDSTLDSSNSFSYPSQETDVLSDNSGNDHLSEISSICSQMQKSFGNSSAEGSLSLQNLTPQCSSFPQTANSSNSGEESEKWPSKTTSSSFTSNSINNHPVANSEPKHAKNLVGNISLRTPVTPITFNPFPTSRKSPSKLPTEIGVKLGLYDANSSKTDKILHSPSKSSSSPTKRKFYW